MHRKTEFWFIFFFVTYFYILTIEKRPAKIKSIQFQACLILFGNNILSTFSVCLFICFFFVVLIMLMYLTVNQRVPSSIRQDYEFQSNLSKVTLKSFATGDVSQARHWFQCRLYLWYKQKKLSYNNFVGVSYFCLESVCKFDDTSIYTYTHSELLNEHESFYVLLFSLNILRSYRFFLFVYIFCR